MEPLNLPPCDFTIKEDNGRSFIFDSIRKKYILLTPEEWVRQHFIQLLICDYHYPRSLISCESGFIMNELEKRTDIVVFNREMQPFLLVECKAPSVPVNAKTLQQASIYNKHLQAPYISLTNGLKTFCFETTGSGLKQIKDLPVYE